ncbi:PQQ-binding-like beta-propeller repeat protein [Planctomyces sp. SH-PL14]|uniref:PQQ-binding-like beta-propeller repeat protein n=1 Tax=Planctomyces sp. SH-PL14 TaxID=1632864 RepID=UPI00078EAB2F|nr:PQQ-binding-like beta-propeller repeat protein [Planctomyces sp. SH-PL14]AMV21449.1 outer membrane biogenesis protein BamB [Planctomyces sp. SH-PL14]
MRSAAAFSLAALLCSSPILADNWPNWRGPQHNGVAAGAFPIEWSGEKNLKWKIDLPSGGSTPIVWEGRIYVTCGKEGKNILVALDLNGKTAWEAVIGDERKGKHQKATGANPSAVTDGQVIAVYYKSGDVAGVDRSGKVLWEKNLQKEYGEDTLWWDLGTSPVMTKNHVIVTVMQSEPSPSYLAALDKKTGEIAWKVDRNVPAPKEAAQSYTTPVVLQHGGKEIVVVLGADHVTAHDAANGQELWRVGGLNPEQNGFFRSISSPVIDGNIVVAPYARGNSLTAIRLGGTGDVTKSHVQWTKGELSADVPTPVAHNGKVYVATDKGKAGCLNVETGDEVWTASLPKNRLAYSASPVLANGHLYLTREDGTTFVLDAASGKLLATNPLPQEEKTVATPVLVNGNVLLRTFEHLYCFGGEAAPAG